MWSWVLHRITGATIFFFLFVHVLDTALVRVSPQTYNEVRGNYARSLYLIDTVSGATVSGS